MNNLNLIGDVDLKLLLKTIEFVENLDNNDDVTIQLSTYGGCVYTGLSIYNILKHISNNVSIVTHGACMSAGVSILMGGDRRAAMPDSELLVHYGEEVNTCGLEAKQNSSLTNKMIKIISEGCGKSVRSVKRWMDKETYFTKETALKNGLLTDRLLNDE